MKNRGHVRIGSGLLQVYDFEAASYNQLSGADMVSTGSLFACYGCRFTVPLPADAAVSSYAAFTGEVFVLLDGTITEYGKGGSSGSETSGTWSPILRGSNGTTLSNYSASGTWRKVGSIVYITMSWTISSRGSASGSLQVTNLPFARTAESSSWAGRIVSGASGTADGYLLQAFGGTATPTLLNIARYDAVSVIVNGYNCHLSGDYQAA